MTLPSANTPLYNHPLPMIEKWLLDLGCEQDPKLPHCWTVQRPTWKAEIYLEIEELIVHYFSIAGRGDVQRSFKYSLSRKDIESAVFDGP